LPPNANPRHHVEAPFAEGELKNTAEVELVCPRCGYRMMRTAARLRRETGIVCPSCGEPVAPGTDERAKDASGPS
jgi:DNA-directed RNA polymerase subunit RPC12/RpoP